MKDIRLKALLIFTTAGLILYGCFLGNRFLFDDGHVILKNVFLRNIQFIPYYFKGYITSVTDKALGIRPLVMLTFNLNYALNGYNPWGYRLFNVFLHILNSWLLFLILLKLFPTVRTRSSLLVCLLFIVHPINVEAVSYISARSDLLLTLFVLLSFYYFLLFEERCSGINCGYKCIFTKPYIFSVIFCSAAFLTKASAISLPLFLMWYILTSRDGNGLKRKLIKITPFLMVSILYMRYRFWLYRDKALGIGEKKDLWLNVLTQAKVVWYYIRLFIWPNKLSVDHQDLIIQNPYEVTFLILLLGVIIVFFCSCFKGENRIKIWFFWYISFLFPKFVATLNFPAMEHHFYLPGIGIYMGSAFVLDKLLLVMPGVAFYGVLVLCCILGKITFVRNWELKNEESVLESAVGVNPCAIYSLYRLGISYEKNGKYNKALRTLKKILSGRSSEKIVVQTLIQIADIYRVIKNYSKAEYVVLSAFKLAPDYPLGFHQLGLIYLDQGEIEQAESCFLKQLERTKDGQQCLVKIADAFSHRGYYELAIKFWEQLQDSAPHLPDSYIGLAEIYEKQNKIEEAIKEYQRAVVLSPLVYEWHFKLGTLYALKGDKRAESELKTALRLNPRASEVYYNLGLFYLSRGRDLNFVRKYLWRAQKLGYKIPEPVLQFLNDG